MTATRVVITGIGVVSSIGIGVSEFTDALRVGKSGISKISAFDTNGFGSDQGGEIKEFDPERWIRRLNPKKLGRTSQLAVSAARLAIEDAAVGPTMLSDHRWAVAIGTTDGEAQVIERMTRQWLEHGPEWLDPDLVDQMPSDRLSLSIGQEFGLRSEFMTIATACAAGNYAIGHAFDLIRSGEADFAMCGGADSICRKTFTGFYRLGAIAPLACQPFDANRKGILTGEGAAILLIESLGNALDRRARIYAEILGYGSNCDAKHMVAPDSHSIAQCMRQAHANAGVTPKDIDYICAHGPGTKTNDLIESSAIREVFGDNAPPISSIKSMIGHTMGAASAIAASACALALYHQFIPPTINYQTVDPECGLDCVPNHARNTELAVVQNNGFAFGGNNAILILKRASAV